MTQEEIKNNFSQNLIKLRKSNGLTQLALAEKLNYSDKAVSKWEVGSVLPDIETMSHIADFFGTTVNDLIYPEKKFKRVFWKNHLFITLISIALAWLLAITTFLILQQTTNLPRLWLTFTITVSTSMIILVVFSSIWFKKIAIMISISGLLWSIITNIFLIVNTSSLWIIFIIGVVGQIIIVFWSQLKKIRIPKYRKRNKEKLKEK
jgi:transcriptional regulator with XRE-family HTH domain